jgi:hypothetical protein
LKIGFHPIKAKPRSNRDGSALICALCTILVISLIGAGVLLNCTTRYNVSSKQVDGWKEALYAAEGGGDIAFSEVRKLVSSPSSAFLMSNGWTTTAGPSYSHGSYNFGQNNSLSASVTVDQLTALLSGQQQSYYRIRSKGTARLFGLPRVGMDDRVDNATKGDSLLRKIDFRYDHFKAAYGDGDGNGKAIQTVPNPQITRRIELIAVPQMSFLFTDALKVGKAFSGPGSAGVVDSYNGKNFHDHPGYSYNRSDDTNTSSQYYSDSGHGSVAVGTASFSEGGPIYGNVTTNGGNVTHSNSNISGTIDNNVPFTIPPVVIPDTTGFTAASGTTLNLPTGTTAASPATYVYSSLSSGLTITGQPVASGPNAGKPAETYVIIVVGSAGSTTGDIGGITLGKGVNAKIYFTGSMNVKARDLVNNNVDGAIGIYNADGSASTAYSRAGHLQFYGVSPTDGSTQSVAIAPPGNIWATIDAPSANISLTGNPDWFGAVVASSFTGNGNTGFHYDTQLGLLSGPVTDYQIASYIEDVR